MKKNARNQPGRQANVPSRAALEALPKVTTPRKDNVPPPIEDDLDDDAAHPAGGNSGEKLREEVHQDRVGRLFDQFTRIVGEDFEAHGKKPMSTEDSIKFLWAVIRTWTGTPNAPMTLLNFEWMLNPRYRQMFTRVPMETKKFLMHRATDVLAEANEKTDPLVIAHLKKVRDGEIPFGWRLADPPATAE